MRMTCSSVNPALIIPDPCCRGTLVFNFIWSGNPSAGQLRLLGLTETDLDNIAQKQAAQALADGRPIF